MKEEAEIFRFVSKSAHSTDYHYFYLHEFEIASNGNQLSFSDLLAAFTHGPHFTLTNEFQRNQQKNKFGQLLPSSKWISHYGFLASSLKIEDFKVFQGRDLKLIIQNFINEDDWGNDLTDFKENYIKSKLSIDHFQVENDVLFYINQDWFVGTDKLTDDHYIFNYFLTFVLINQSKTRLLILDYGYD